MKDRPRKAAPAPRSTWLAPLILLGMGGYLCLLLLTGNINHYINERFAWLAALAALLFAVLGLVALRSRLQAAAHSEPIQTSWDSLLICSLPLLLGIFIPSRALGIEAINGGISLSPVGVSSAASFTRDPLDRNILDWLREFDRALSPAAFDGTAADVVGFVYREPSYPEDTFMLSRFTMSCCVADAFPVGMPVQVAGAGSYAAGEWLRVGGGLQARDFDGQRMPVLVADTVEPVPQPAQPYLYP